MVKSLVRITLYFLKVTTLESTEVKEVKFVSVDEAPTSTPDEQSSNWVSVNLGTSQVLLLSVTITLVCTVHAYAVAQSHEFSKKN